MARTTARDLDQMVKRLIVATGDDTLFIGHAYGRPRLESHGGAFEISPRLPAGALLEWMQAYHAGVFAREAADARRERMAEMAERRS